MAASKIEKVEQTIITNLVEEALKVKIFKVSKKKNEDDGSVYYLISAINLANKQSITLSLSELMREKFGFSEIIKEGVYLTDTNKAIYQHLNAVYIPSTGETYGYVTKEGQTVAYKSKGCYIIKQFHGALSADFIQQYETLDIADERSLKSAKLKFRIKMRREYVEGISEQDDDMLISFM